MIRSYISAIRSVLAEDGFELESHNFTINSLTRACKIRNDHLVVRLPIHKSLLHILIKEIIQWTLETSQPYLEHLYTAILTAGYYGLLRIVELTCGPHCILAENVHVGINKRKLLFMLCSSKMHDKGDKPQIIKISSTAPCGSVSPYPHCPYTIIQNYIDVRPVARGPQEQFFVFSDGRAVHPYQLRRVLKLLFDRLRIDSSLFSVHSLRIGRAGDLLKRGVSVETIKKIGRWRSNAVFTYLPD